jgi:hypothetical protein
MTNTVAYLLKARIVKTEETAVASEVVFLKNKKQSNMHKKDTKFGRN